MDIFQALFWVAVVILFILLILILVYKVKISALRDDIAACKNRIRETTPYKIGQMFHNDEDNIPDEIVVSLSSKLVPIQEGSSPLKLMGILERFFKDPAQMFDEFYDPAQPFGVVLPISRITPSNTRTNSYFIVIKDLAGREYYLLMEGLPEYVTYKFKVVGSK